MLCAQLNRCVKKCQTFLRPTCGRRASPWHRLWPAVVRFVRPSVRVSVTFVYSVETSNRILKLFYRRVVTPFQYLRTKRYGNIPREGELSWRGKCPAGIFAGEYVQEGMSGYPFTVGGLCLSAVGVFGVRSDVHGRYLQRPCGQ